MGYLDDQIDVRKKKDEQLLYESVFQLEDAVLPRKYGVHFRVTEDSFHDATEQICAYLKVDIPNISNSSKSELGALDEIPHRKVSLKHAWYKGGSYPMLVMTKDGKAMAVLPASNGFYYYNERGRKTYLRKKDAEKIQGEACCFFRTFPEELGKKEMRHFLFDSFSWIDALKILVAAVIMTFSGAITPWITESLLSGTTNQGLFVAMLSLVFAALSYCLFFLIREMLTCKMSLKLGFAMEIAVMNHIMHKSVSYFKERNAGGLENTVSNSRALAIKSVHFLFEVALTVPPMVIYYIQIYLYVPKLFWMSMIVSVVILGFYMWIVHMNVQIHDDNVKATANEKCISYTMIRGVMKLRLAGAEKRAFSKWGIAHADTARSVYCAPALYKMGNAVPNIIIMLGTLFFFGFSYLFDIGSSQYVVFSTTFALIAANYAILFDAATMYGEIKSGFQLLLPVLRAGQTDSKRKKESYNIRGNVELSHVSFRYQKDDPEIIHDLSLKIKSGEYVALVGNSGSGKSTMLRLILGFEKPSKGAVYYDQHDLAKTDMNALRSRIGVVLQNDNLFPGGDIYSNLSIAKPNLTEEEAWQALRLAGMEEEVRQMPMGLYTLVTESGSFSGGQKQRLLIARAIVSKPRLLILDEATSALDNITQKKVSDALNGLKCTRIVAAHRLSTIVQCDRILVMDKGKVVEDGTYDELMKKGGFFSRLVNRQIV